MHIVTISLRRHAADAAEAIEAGAIDVEAFAHKLRVADDFARVEHARVVAAASRVDVVLFLLAPSYCQAHAAALRFCRHAMESAAVSGWAIENPAARP